MTTPKAKSKNQPDDLDLKFYEATAAAGRLCIQRCSACGHRTHPARYFCPSCSSDQYSFEPVSGRAVVHSYTVSHFSVESGWKELVPYVSIVAELEEGPRVIARTSAITPGDVAIGMPIALEVEVVSPEFSYVWAKPAEGGE